MSLEQIFCEYLGFSWQFSFHRLLHISHLSSGAETIGQLVADIPSRLGLTPQQGTKKRLLKTTQTGRKADMPLVTFKHITPVFEWAKTFRALKSAATVIGFSLLKTEFSFSYLSVEYCER
jgi:hypothetical protein